VTKGTRSPRPKADVAADLVPLILGLMQAWKERVVLMVDELGLTLSQMEALRNLAQPVSQRELAQCLHFDASNITDIVDRLQERGLVERQVDPQDRRVRRVVLTPEGEATRRKLMESLVAELPVLQKLTASEQRALRDLLAKAVEPADLLV
jgi:DNA-binding MarR family transcriptional regulator